MSLSSFKVHTPDIQLVTPEQRLRKGGLKPTLKLKRWTIFSHHKLKNKIITMSLPFGSISLTQQIKVQSTKKRNTLSYEVFMDFVTVTGEIVDVLKIFSIECLKRWVETRSNSVKFPEQSFKRVLYAHIRGADRRRPFPKYIETALLKVLRESNPWELLGKNRKSVGRRAFKHLGYHEKILKEKLVTSEATYDSSVMKILFKTAPYHDDSNPISPEVLLKQMLYAAYHQNFRKNTKEHLDNLRTESILNHCNHAYFISLAKQSKLFDINEQVGSFLTTKTWSIVFQDNLTVRLFGEDTWFLGSKLSLLALSLPVFFVGGTIWRLGFIKKEDDTLVVLKLCVSSENENYLVHYQVESSKYTLADFERLQPKTGERLFVNTVGN